MDPRAAVEGEPESAQGILGIPSPTGICPRRLLRAAGFRGFATRESFNNPANFSLLHLMNMALIWDFFLFSLGRKMIKTRPGNLWCRRGLYLLGKGAAAAFAYSPAHVHVMPHPLFIHTTLDLPHFPKKPQGIPGFIHLLNQRLEKSFSPVPDRIFLKEYPIFHYILQITQLPRLCSGWRPAHSWCLFASQIKAPSSGGIPWKINSLGKLGFSNCLVHLVHYCPSPALIQTVLTACLWRALQSSAYPWCAGGRTSGKLSLCPDLTNNTTINYKYIKQTHKSKLFHLWTPLETILWRLAGN